MVKNQQFFVAKFNSDYLNYHQYNITFNLEQARRNGWIVSLADSQALRTIRRIRYEYYPDSIRYYPECLTNLQNLKKKIKRRKLTPYYRSIIHDIDKRIDQMLFVPEYVTVQIDKKLHYRDMIKDGLIINGASYKRLLAGAGHLRHNTVVFIREDFEDPVKQMLENEANPNIKITPNKFSAYFALSSTATYLIDADSHFNQIPELTPHPIVINDCEFEQIKKVDWCEPKTDQDINLPSGLQNREKIITKEISLPFNAFDGGGLIDISTARKWAEKLELDYIPSVFVVRNIYVKGCLFTVDYKKFAREVGHKSTVTDLYGNEQNIEESDIVLTKSMFKLWNAYTSIEQYQECCNKYHNFWGVARVSPKEDSDWVTTNYQYLQVLNIEDEDVPALCKTTRDWLLNVSGQDYRTAMLFLMGKLADKTGDPDFKWDSISDNITRALAICPNMINDDYIRQSLTKAINTKIKESYIGKLIVRGNFSTMIPDPYAAMEWLCAEGDVSKVHGLLNEFEHYSSFWNKRNVTDVIACRSPLTWRSEVNKLNLKKNNDTEEWYQYLNSGVVYNIWGCDCMLHAD